MDRGAFGGFAGLAAGVQCVLLFEVLRRGAVGVGPWAEVMDLAANALGPVASGVGVQGEFGIGLRGFASSGLGGRIVNGHANVSLTWCWCGPAGTVTTPR